MSVDYRKGPPTPVFRPRLTTLKIYDVSHVTLSPRHARFSHVMLKSLVEPGDEARYCLSILTMTLLMHLLPLFTLYSSSSCTLQSEPVPSTRSRAYGNVINVYTFFTPNWNVRVLGLVN